LGLSSRLWGYALSFTEHHPSRVRQVILLDSVGLTLPSVPFFEAMKWPLVGELTTKFITPDLIRQQLGTCLFNQRKITTDMVQEWYIPATFHSNRQALYQLVRELDWKQTEQMLPQMRTPLLLMWGK
jgi:pimeloyl-ACP methyl ester carboxylesterase